MSDLLIIGICGKARSGKDTVAQHLVQNHGFFRIGLADGVRSAFQDLDGPTWELRKDIEASYRTSRWALQTLGTECRNAISDPKHWVNHALIKIAYLVKYHPIPRFRFVIPDIRFPHEADQFGLYAEVLGGTWECWKLNRPGDGLAGEAANHTSETSIESVPCGAMINNDQDLPFLFRTIDILMT